MNWTDERIDDLATRVDRRLVQVDRRFTQIDRRFGQVDRRFGQVDAAIGRLRSEVHDTRRELRAEIELSRREARARLQDAVTELGSEIGPVRSAIRRAYKGVDTSQDRYLRLQQRIIAGLTGVFLLLVWVLVGLAVVLD